MNELEMLMQQKREIERKIKEVKSQGLGRVGNAKIDKSKWGGHDLWYISIKVRDGSPYCEREEQPRRWKSIINDTDRARAVAEIPQIISDLQALYDQEKFGGIDK